MNLGRNCKSIYFNRTSVSCILIHWLVDEVKIVLYWIVSAAGDTSTDHPQSAYWPSELLNLARSNLIGCLCATFESKNTVFLELGNQIEFTRLNRKSAAGMTYFCKPKPRNEIRFVVNTSSRYLLILFYDIHQ